MKRDKAHVTLSRLVIPVNMHRPSEAQLRIVSRKLSLGSLPLANYINDLGYSVHSTREDMFELEDRLQRLRIWTIGGSATEGKNRTIELVSFTRLRVRHCLVHGIPLAVYTKIRYGIEPNEDGYVIVSRGGRIHAVESLVVSRE